MAYSQISMEGAKETDFLSDFDNEDDDTDVDDDVENSIDDTADKGGAGGSQQARCWACVALGAITSVSYCPTKGKSDQSKDCVGAGPRVRMVSWGPSL